MRTADSAIVAAIQAAPEQGLRARNFITIFAEDEGGVNPIGFWNDVDTIEATVIRPQDGATETRTFIGDGAVLDMDPIPLTADLSVRSANVTLSALHASVRNMLYGMKIRGRVAQIHRGIWNPQTGVLVGNLMPHFHGFVNGAPVITGAPGEESTVQIEIVSHTRELTRTSAAKKSDETQKLRSGDRGRKYAGVANVAIWWGKSKGDAASGSGKGSVPRDNTNGGGQIPKGSSH